MEKAFPNPINLEYLNLMTDGDVSMKTILIEMLINELPEEVEKMKKFAIQCNWLEVSNVAHKLKSTLCYVGNNSMTTSNKLIEKFAKEEESLAEIPALINGIEDLISPVIDALTSEIK